MNKAVTLSTSEFLTSQKPSKRDISIYRQKLSESPKLCVFFIFRQGDSNFVYSLAIISPVGAWGCSLETSARTGRPIASS